MDNVRDMERRVKAELRWAPTLAEARTDLRERLSLSYREVCGEKEWPFLRKTIPFWMMPDLALANGLLTRLGDRCFGVTRANLIAAGFNIDTTSGASSILQLLAGAEFGLADETKRALGNGNWQESPFTIEYATVGDPVAFTLDPRCVVPALVGNEGSFAIRKMRYALPSDCANLLEMRNVTDRTKLVPVTAAQFAALDDRAGSTVTHFGPDDGQFTRFPPVLYPDTGVAEVGRNDLMYQRSNEPIRLDPPFTAVAAAGGSLPAATYRLFVSWWYAGRLGPPSREVSVTTTGGNATITVAALPRQEGATVLDTGRRLSLWMAAPEGPFYLVAFGIDPTNAGATFSVQQLPSNSASTTERAWRRRRWDEEYPGAYAYIRPWPRPAATTQFAIEYLQRPRLLIEEVDAPIEAAKGIDDVIVWRTVMRMAGSANSKTTFETAKAQHDVAYRALCRSQGQEERYRPQKGQIDAPSADGLGPFPDLTFNYDGP